MRPPQPGSRWSARRLRRRRAYAAYLTSQAWLARRRRWYDEHLRRTGRSPTCVVCGRPWRLCEDDLHHASYARLGHEAHADLVPMCRADHESLHELWDADPAWRRLGRQQATPGIVAVLRHRHRSISHQPRSNPR